MLRAFEKGTAIPDSAVTMRALCVTVAKNLVIDAQPLHLLASTPSAIARRREAG